jgi:hypothetical protein
MSGAKIIDGLHEAIDHAKQGTPPMTDKLTALVRPLEWEEPCKSNNYTNIARSPFGEYYVHVDGGRHQAWLEAHEKPYERNIGETVGSLYEAKQNAQAQFAASALSTILNPAAIEALERAAEQRGRDAGLRDFDSAGWYWRVMDPDDSSDNPAEVIHRSYMGQFTVCEIASSFSGPTRYGFNAPCLDPDSDGEEFLHFATQQEAIDAAKERHSALALITK